MPKIQFIDPLKPETGLCGISAHSCQSVSKNGKEERENFTDEELKAIYHDMALIREFETMLNLIKTKGEYNGVAYNHPGPATCPSDRSRRPWGWPGRLPWMIYFREPPFAR